MKTEKVYRIGLTGGIASGKSTVSDILRELGAIVIDTDRIAREVTTPGSPALLEMNRRYGPEILNEEGSLRRSAVGRIVFNDPAERKWLEHLLHPLIWARAEQLAKEAAAAGYRIVVFDVPLLFETGWNAWVDEVWTVYIPLDLQRQRLQRRDGYTEAEADSRLASQWPIDQKAERSDRVIDNSGSVEETHRQVESVWRELVNKIGKATGGTL